MVAKINVGISLFGALSYELPLLISTPFSSARFRQLQALLASHSLFSVLLMCCPPISSLPNSHQKHSIYLPTENVYIAYNRNHSLFQLSAPCSHVPFRTVAAPTNTPLQHAYSSSCTP